jgi:hypothetical protein
MLPGALAVVVAIAVAAAAPGLAGPAGTGPAGKPVFPSLAQAASQEVGSARNAAAPAVAVSGGRQVVDPKQVLPTDGPSNGCLPGYGHAGQCVPRRAPGNRPVTCAFVRTVMPKGVMVHGPDRLGFDRNGDGVACGAGDGP